MKVRNLAVVCFLFIFAVLGAVVFARKSGGDTGMNVKVGDTAPDFTVMMTDGSSVSLSSLKGKPVLLHFWADWCPPCVKELPLIVEAASKYSSEMTVLPVAVGGNIEGISAYLSKRGKAFSSFVSGVDEDLSVALLYGAHGIPCTFFIDGDGVVTDSQLGAYSKTSLEDAIKRALKK